MAVMARNEEASIPSSKNRIPYLGGSLFFAAAYDILKLEYFDILTLEYSAKNANETSLVSPISLGGKASF